MQNTDPHRGESEPLVIAKQGYMFSGGEYFSTGDGHFMSGQMYAEYQIPHDRTHEFPIVMMAGGSQSGINFTGTPDGRDGWAQYFLREGYAVYVTDQPARGRSAYHPDAVGSMRRTNQATIEQRFSTPEKAGLWPQAKLHTQWPGRGSRGDKIFDQFMAQELPSLADFGRQQALNRDAGVALLEKIGPSILLTHSQAGTFGWLIADARPDLVSAIVAIEPNGPPVHDIIFSPRSECPFLEGPLTKPFGLTSEPLTYSPKVDDPQKDLSFVKSTEESDPSLACCWLQREPARQLIRLKNIPVLILQGEASYHAPYDHGTVKYLEQAGVKVDFIRLADIGIHGNGHMMMLEKNNLEIADVIENWLDRSLPKHPA